MDDALDAMEDAIKLELTNEGNESEARAANEPVGTTTVTAADLPTVTTSPSAPAPVAKPAAPKAAVVRGGAADVNGRLPPEVISRTVRANFSRFRACYESGLRSNPDLRGRVTTRFVIDRSGAVSTAADNGSDLPDRQVVQCVVRGFGGLSFPQPEGGIVTVSYPINFQPGS